MNKAITDGLVFMPTPFKTGLDRWSSGDGLPGSASYANVSNAAFVPADADFGGCMEMLKTQATQKLRYFGETVVLPGCYLRVTARVKAVSGNLPSVRIAAWAGGAGGGNVASVPQTGPSTALTAYGEVVTVSAIVGSGARTGVDLVWGTVPTFGHFGLDLTGANGGVVRIDDIEIEDITQAFYRTLLDVVDVRDYGAIGNGAADDRAAFQAADDAAAGRTVLVSKGTYRLGDNVTFASPVRFEGTVTMPADKRLALTRNFDLASYTFAFGDEQLGFRKALQALFAFTDHVTLDLNGRRLEIDAPIDVRAVAGDLDTFSQRRGLRNGQLNVQPSTAWNTETVTSQATYAIATPTTLKGVTNVANVKVGSLVTGVGVGREVYVRARNVGAGTLTLSQPLVGAVGTQVYTFRRFKYVLDFSGMSSLDKFEMADIDFQLAGECSGILLPPSGQAFVLRDCVVNRPKDRAISSPGTGCQGMQIDGCQFLSNEQSVRTQDRTTIVLNVNGNDTKLRTNRVVRFAHFAVMAGSGHIILGNHLFHGDDETAGIRRAGIVLTDTSLHTTVTANYIDNAFLEWTNEHDARPEFSSEFSFGGLTITGNIFLASNVAPWFKWIVITPRGPGHYLQGFNMTGNVFKSSSGTVDRPDTIDTTYASLDAGRTRNVIVGGNSFNGVTQPIASPVLIEHNQGTAAVTWTVDPAGYLPFGFWARNVAGVVPEGPITGPGGEARTDLPYVTVEQGPAKGFVRLNWAAAAKGRAHVTVRCDNPV